MKILTIILFLWVITLLQACEKELKEHPIPPALKQQLAMQNDPKIKAREIHGTVTVTPKLAKSLPENSQLFIIARPEGIPGGPPLAVKRHSMATFPFEYHIGQLNVMLEGNVFEGMLQITARVDADGNRKASAGDVVGERTVAAGTKDADIVLDRLIEGVRESVSGVIRLDPKLEAKVPENGTLFIIARSVGARRGPPLAVKRLTGIKFPYKFQLGAENLMMPGMNFAGEINLTVRLDQDGDARPAPGDIEGSQPAFVGDDNIEIVLNRVIEG